MPAAIVADSRDRAARTALQLVVYQRAGGRGMGMLMGSTKPPIR